MKKTVIIGDGTGHGFIHSRKKRHDDRNDRPLAEVRGEGGGVSDQALAPIDRRPT